ncbi:hypothetical protein [Haloplanus halobius]|uniref:hypothetical protein n=1 Tax=Haloplanus halobius TaxID=2934938 RepID=UPI00200BCA1B|nr:hypothetical protein [Haloplanus sp. XH21]
MVDRPALPTLLVAAGVVCVLASAAPIGGGPSDVDYVHHVEPAENGTLAYGIEYEESDVLAYENLSDRGQRAVARGVADSPYVVENESATAPEFQYTSDHVALGEGLSPVRDEGEVYSVRTEQRSSGFNVAALLLGLALSAARGVGLVLIVAGLALAGWRRYQRS